MNDPRRWLTLLLLLALLLPALPAGAAQPFPPPGATARGDLPGPVGRGDYTVPQPAPVGPARPDGGELQAGFTWTPITPTAGQVITLTGWVTGTWLSDTVYGSSVFPSLALDALGRPHVTYVGPDGFSYAYYDGTNWQIEIVDPGLFMGWISSLVLDPAGYPHVSYTDRDQGLTRYAAYDGAAWTLQTIEDDGPGGGGAISSLVLDSMSRPHVLYSTRPYLLAYARYDGTAWVTETVTSGAVPGSSRSLVLDALERPHIVSRGQGLFYSYYDGTEWISQTVDPSACSYASLALDTAGRPHISYDSASSDQYVRYASYDGAQWHIETIDSDLGESGGIPSLVLDDQGHPHISYYDDNRGLVRYAYYDGTSWQFMTAGWAGSNWQYPTGLTSLVLDADERPHIAYHLQDWLTDPVLYTHLFPATPPFTYNWRLGDGSVATGEKVHHAYTEPGDYTVVMEVAAIAGTATVTHTITIPPLPCDPVTAAGFTWTPPVPYSGSPVTLTASAMGAGIGWITQTVSSSNQHGAAPSLALDSIGIPHITWGGLNAPGLKYAFYCGDRWCESEIAPYGGFPSLALDSAGGPHVATTNSSQGYRLEYGYYDGPAWHFEAVDNQTVLYPSLALDATDRPHISYGAAVGPWPGEPFELRYAFLSGTNWLTQTVDAGVDATFSSLALDADAHPHIVYNVRLSNEIRYAWYDGAAWHTTTVDSVPPTDYGSSVAIALNAAGRPHLGYTDYVNSQLKYAWHDGTSWHIETVVDGIQFGNAVSLVLDSLGRPHLGYAGADNSVRHAYKDGLAWQVERVDTGGTSISFGISLALDSWDRPHLAYQVASEYRGEIRFAEKVWDYATRPISYTWDLGDGTTATGEAIYHTYAQSGTYTVTLTASNCATATVTAVYAIRVLTPPCDPVTMADFTWVPLTPTTGSPLTFTAEVQAGKWLSETIDFESWDDWNSLAVDSAEWPAAPTPPITYTWDFGDGMVSIGITTTHTYVEPGAYTVTLTTGNHCGQATAVHTVTILAPCAPVTMTDFTWTPLTPTAGSPLTLTAEAWADEWFRETVEPQGLDFWNSLAVDSAGWPHLAYYDAYSSTVQYAWKDGADWHTQAVTDNIGGASTYTYCDLALDSLDRPHIAYYNEGSNAIEYASYDGTTWQTEVLAHPNSPANGLVSLALDSQDRPHVSFSTFNGSGAGALYYLHYDGSWQSEIVESGLGSYHSALALDQAGRAHLSYVTCDNLYPDCHDERVMYAYNDGTSWQAQVVDNSGAIGRWLSLALDATGRPHVAYAKWDGDSHLYYAYLEGSNWVIEVLSSSNSDFPMTLALALDGLGYPHIAYMDPGWSSSGLHYTYYDGTAWQRENVQESYYGDMFAAPSLVIGADGRRYLGYSDFWPRYAEWPTEPTPPITYTWDLGDGAIATGEVVTHTYARPGLYTVTLTAVNCATATVTAVHTITVVAPPACEPVEITTVTSAISGCAVALTGDVTGTAPFTWLWAFGDGVTSTLAAPVHVYTASGAYAGTVEVWNCSGNGHGQRVFTVTVGCTVPPTSYTIYLPLVVKGYR